MLQEFLADTRHAGWALAAFILFFLIFLGVIGYLARGLIRHKSYDDVASLPLQDDPSEGEKGGSLR